MFLKFSNIHRKTPVLESLLNKVAGLIGCSLIEKKLELQYRCFTVEYHEMFKNSFFIEHLWWLVLLVVILEKLEVTPYEKTPIQKGHQRNIKPKKNTASNHLANEANVNNIN